MAHGNTFDRLFEVRNENLPVILQNIVRKKAKTISNFWKSTPIRIKLRLLKKSK